VTAVPTPEGTLHALALQAELRRHAQRMAELEAMQPQLRMLDEFTAPLRARGLDLVNESLGIAFSLRNKEVHVRAGAFDSTNWDLFDALIDLGFVVTRRTDYTSYATVRMQRENLRLCMQVSLKREAVAA
jgi:hypothetical protein